MHRLGEDMNEEDIESIMQRGDEDGNGQITYDEIVKCLLNKLF